MQDAQRVAAESATGGFVSRRLVRGFVQEADSREEGSPGAQTDLLREGERVVLLVLDEPGPVRERHPLRLTGSKERVEGLGVVDTSRIVGHPPGRVHSIASRRFLVLRPDLRDHQAMIRRKAQLVLPKDAAQIVAGCALGPGARVAEAGVGSGALTVSLAWSVGDSGRIHGYDVRQDHLEAARRNVERTGLASRVEFRLADVTQGLQESGLDAVVLDLPEPSAVIAHVTEALRPGGRVAAYLPTVHQMEDTVRGLEEAGFLEVESQEVWVRSWHVKGRSVRPSFEMLAHTAWLVFGRWPGPVVAD